MVRKWKREITTERFYQVIQIIKIRKVWKKVVASRSLRGDFTAVRMTGAICLGSLKNISMKHSNFTIPSCFAFQIRKDLSYIQVNTLPQCDCSVNT